MPGFEGFEKKVGVLPANPETTAAPVDLKSEDDVTKALEAKLKNLQLPQ